MHWLYVRMTGHDVMSRYPSRVSPKHADASTDSDFL